MKARLATCILIGLLDFFSVLDDEAESALEGALAPL